MLSCRVLYQRGDVANLLCVCTGQSHYLESRIHADNWEKVEISDCSAKFSVV
jgi:hypothetical protein